MLNPPNGNILPLNGLYIGVKENLNTIPLFSLWNLWPIVAVI